MNVSARLLKARRAYQRGGALLVSMIMVLLVLMLAVVGMRTVTLGASYWRQYAGKSASL